MGSDLLLQTLQRDLLENILQYSADIKKCAESMTSQIREMIGTQVVALFERDPAGEYHLLSSCPERKGVIFRREESRRIVALAGDFHQATLIKPGQGEIGRTLAGLNLKESFFVPLRVGDEVFGMLILLDLMDHLGIEQILAALQDISGLLSLMFKNSYLYRNMELLVEQRSRALLESESRSRSILKTAMDGFWRIDPATGRLLEVNDAYCTISGYSHDELLSMSLAQLEANQSSEEVAAHVQTVLTRGFDSFETVHRRKDGNLVNLEVNVQMHSGRDGREMVAFLRDITQRKRLEEERKHLQLQLQQAQKMEAIGTLAGGIAHDFNNILGAILGYAEMAQDDTPPGSQARKDIDQVVKAGHRAKELVMQILAFSRQAESEKIPLQPGAILKESIKLLRSSLPSTIAIRQDIDADGLSILADPTQIHQVMMNLCTNAFHAMELNGGTLTISLKKRTLSPADQAKDPALPAEDMVELAIGDTGIGIGPEIRDKIFDPYFTTKEIGKGTGMGLSIVHGIVKSHGGSIACDSQPGKGTVFRVLLPAFAGTGLPLPASPVALPLGNEHILFIDDEQLLVDMGKTLFERLGYRVTTRSSSIDALNTFQNQPRVFDLVITDQTMPVMTGSDLARRMLQIRPDTPIILCTGYSNLTSEGQAKALGIRGFAMKPLAKKDIAVLIRKVLDEKSR